MRRERLKLVGGDWARYFAPVAICGYIAAICAALIITSIFLANRHQGLAISDAGELIVVEFRPDEVLVASICDPSIGFSLVGQRRCQQHREVVVHALAG